MGVGQNEVFARFFGQGDAFFAEKVGVELGIEHDFFEFLRRFIVASEVVVAPAGLVDGVAEDGVVLKGSRLLVRIERFVEVAVFLFGELKVVLAKSQP